MGSPFLHEHTRIRLLHLWWTHDLDFYILLILRVSYRYTLVICFPKSHFPLYPSLLTALFSNSLIPHKYPWRNSWHDRFGARSLSVSSWRENFNWVPGILYLLGLHTPLEDFALSISSFNFLSAKFLFTEGDN